MKWSWFDKIGFSVVTIGSVLCGLWLFVGSHLFLKPIALRLDGYDFIFLRETPFGDVDAKWSAEMVLMDRGDTRFDSYECDLGNGRRMFQESEHNLVTGSLTSSAKPCVEAGPPMVFRASYQVMLFGLIPLRPVYFVQNIAGVSK